MIGVCKVSEDYYKAFKINGKIEPKLSFNSLKEFIKFSLKKSVRGICPDPEFSDSEVNLLKNRLNSKFYDFNPFPIKEEVSLSEVNQLAEVKAAQVNGSYNLIDDYC